ncbi:zinc-ribbon domain-containing protein [Methanosphaerula palustris]|nr:zinc-ribbon domain-containing protein [Methanosphaerula palustris]
MIIPFCNNCGKPVAEGKNYCEACGRRLDHLDSSLRMLIPHNPKPGNVRWNVVLGMPVGLIVGLGLATFLLGAGYYLQAAMFVGIGAVGLVLIRHLDSRYR